MSASSVTQHRAAVVMCAVLSRLLLTSASIPDPTGQSVEVSSGGLPRLLRRDGETACEARCLHAMHAQAPHLSARDFSEAVGSLVDAAAHFLGIAREPEKFVDFAQDPEREIAHTFGKDAAPMLKFFLTRTESLWSDSARPEWFREVAEIEGFTPSGVTSEPDPGEIAATSVISAGAAVLFAARQARLALKALEPCAVQGTLGEIARLHEEMSCAFKDTFPSLGGQGPWGGAYRRVRSLGASLFASLRAPQTVALLAKASTCEFPFDAANLAKAFTQPQQTRVHPDTSKITMSSYLSLPVGTSSSDLQMPLLGMGTGHSDCYKGRQLVTEHNDEGGEVIVMSDEPCIEEGAPEGWAADFSLVDTAALYGSERAVGDALHRSGRPRKDFFVITKPPVRAMWSLLGVPNVTAHLGRQLADLRTESVDVLMYHHDVFSSADWLAMQSAMSQRKARALGVTSTEAAEAAVTCVQEGICETVPVLAEEPWSPCHYKGLRALGPRARAAGVSLLGTGAVWPCLGEPHVAAVAKRHEVSPAAVSIRWALQTGVPVLIQTTRAEHLRGAARALDFELSQEEMALIGSLTLLYRLGDQASLVDDEILRAFGESTTNKCP